MAIKAYDPSIKNRWSDNNKKRKLLIFQKELDFLLFFIKKELVQPGCTQCIRNACRAKYTQRIMGILNSEIDPKAPPPSAAKPPVRQQPNPPQNSNASQRQQPPGYVSPELIPPNPGGNKEVVEPGVSQEEKQENEVQDITRAPFGKL
jgi:hypothetical protein